MKARLLLLALFCATSAHAETDHDCLTNAIFQEARGELPPGKLAVGNVIMNRWRSGEYGSSICDIVYSHTTTEDADGLHINCDFSWYCAQKPYPTIPSDALLASGYIADGLLEGRLHDNTNNSTFFYSRSVWKSAPPWFSRAVELGKIVKTVAIGRHVFYKLSTAKITIGYRY